MCQHCEHEHKRFGATYGSQLQLSESMQDKEIAYTTYTPIQIQLAAKKL